ncbi:MAG: hypothetical protein M0C28_22235 [Candidatus Moduliflexus flocculans]|nr:hypothetical protein [Candidatus Moduliflexus flocculans]
MERYPSAAWVSQSCALILHKVSAGEVIDFYQEAAVCRRKCRGTCGGSSQIFSKLQFHVESHGRINSNEKVTRADSGRMDKSGGVKTERETYETGTGHLCSHGCHFCSRLQIMRIFSEDFTEYTAKGIEHSSCLSYRFYNQLPCDGHQRAASLAIDVPVWARFQTNADPTFTPQGRYSSTWGIMLPWGFDGDPEVVEATEKRLKTPIAMLFPNLLPNLIKERRLVIASDERECSHHSSQSRPHRPGIVV